MTESGWVVAVVVLVAGLLSGFALAAMTRRKGGVLPVDPAFVARLNELRARRAQLMEQLRLIGIDGAGESERPALEREAALVLRELDLLEGRLMPGAAAVAPAPVAPAAPVMAAPAAPAPVPVAPAMHHAAAAPRPAQSGGMSPQLVGALKGAAVVGVAFLLYTALSDRSGPRAPGGSMTGNDGIGEEAPARPPAPMMGGNQGGGGAGEAMGAQGGQEQQAGSLAPAMSPRLAAAVERLEANPESRDAKVELGWALVEGRGWIDVYHTADELLAANAEDPDGLALAAAVRLAMGQRDGIAELLDKAVEKAPGNAMALAWRGRLAQLQGDQGAQNLFWTQARSAASDKGAIEKVISEFEAAGTAPPRHPGPNDAPSQPMAPQQPAAPATAEGGTEAFEGGISGTVKLAPGAQVPPGAVLFVIARVPGVNGGPPTATRKILGPTFPRAFTLGPSDVMMGGAFPSSVTVQARLDTDGNPMTREATDLVASWPDAISVGQRGVVLELAPVQ